jgi:uncharacterized protein involved in exopolysaccharide biosynthesis
VSLFQFFRILWARRWIILPAFLICVATAGIVSQFLPERFRASSRVVLDTFKPDPITGQVIASNLLRAFAQTQVELIQDYRVAGRVVDSLGWANDPGNIAAFGASPAAASGDIRRWLAQNIINNTRAGLIEGTNILEISYTDTSPERAEQITNLIRRAFFDESLAFKRDAAARAATWYSQQVDSSRKVLADAEAARTGFAKANGIVLTNDGDLDSQTLTQLAGQNAAAAGAPATAPPPAGPAQAQLAQLDQQIVQAAETLGPNHPMFQALQRQRIALAQTAAREAAASQSLGVNRGAIEGALNVQRSKVIADREKLDQINQMQRDIALKRDQYMKASGRVADLRLEANSADPGMTSLGDANAPQTPFFPNVPLIVGASAAFGLGLGVLVALLVELLGRRIRSKEDLEHAINAPVFAVVQSGSSLPNRLRRGYREAAHTLEERGVAVS